MGYYPINGTDPDSKCRSMMERRIARRGLILSRRRRNESVKRRKKRKFTKIIHPHKNLIFFPFITTKTIFYICVDIFSHTHKTIVLFFPYSINVDFIFVPLLKIHRSFKKKKILSKSMFYGKINKINKMNIQQKKKKKKSRVFSFRGLIVTCAFFA